MTLAQITNDDGSLTHGAGIALAVTLGIAALAILILIIVALVSIAGNDRLTGGGKAVWAVVIIAFPLLGSVGWFFWGKAATLNRTPGSYPNPSDGTQ